MKVKVTFDYPTIEGMVYADTVLKVSTEDFNLKQHSEKVKGVTDVGKIIWVPRKLLEEIKSHLEAYKLYLLETFINYHQ